MISVDAVFGARRNAVAAGLTSIASLAVDNDADGHTNTAMPNA